MHHDDDVRAKLNRPPVAGLLVGPVAQVDVVEDRLQAEFTSQGNGMVGAGVVNEHYLVYDLSVKFGYCTRQREFCIVGRQHNADPAAINHAASVWSVGVRSPADCRRCAARPGMRNVSMGLTEASGVAGSGCGVA